MPLEYLKGDVPFYIFGVAGNTPEGQGLYRVYCESRGDYRETYRAYCKIRDEGQAFMAVRHMREDVESWDIQTRRQWPYFTIAMRPYDGVPANVEVHIGVNFLNDEAAREFEAAVRKLLEGPA